MPDATSERKYHFFVDNVKYEVSSPSITGADIKSLIPNFDRSYALYLEGQGADPDRLVTDTDAMNLEKGPHKFYTVPPASFGYR